jgi:NADPH2:quinone reductase
MTLAVGLKTHGGPEVLQIVDLPSESLAPGKVRLRVHAAAINPTDVMARNGSRADQQKLDPPPYVPGMDAAGIVEEVGEGVSLPIKPGGLVMAMVVPRAQHGAYREEIVLDQRAIVPQPKNVTHAEAASLPMNSLTAQLSLDLMDLKAGQTICVTGAPGAYGGYVVQLAKHAGLTVLADASEADEALVKSLGADVIVRRGEGFASRVRAVCPEGVDGLADGALLNELAIPAVRDGGKFTAIRGYTGNGERGINFSQTFVRNYDCEWEKLDRLRQLTNDGVLTLRVADEVNPDKAGEAHARLEAGGTRGRLIIKFG